MTENQRWYREDFLPSNHFRAVREKVYKKHPYCQICKKRFDLQPHHISYNRRGTRDEWKDIRMLCSHHHQSCHFILWVIKIPLSSDMLYGRYFFVKLRHIVIQTFLSYRLDKR